MDIGKLLVADGSGGASRGRAPDTNAGCSASERPLAVADERSGQGTTSSAPGQSSPPATIDAFSISPVDRSAGLSLLATLAETHDVAARLAADSASSGHSTAAASDPPAPAPRPSPDSEHTRTPAPPPRRQRPTTGEKARERKLRDDAMALVISPQLVLCQRCGARIKLSLKSTYDPFHWQKHKERCLKRPDAVARELKVQNEQSQRKPAFPSASRLRSARKLSPASSLTPPPPSPEPAPAVKQEPRSPSPMRLSPAVSAPESVFRAPDPSFEEYLQRSRRRAMREVTPLTLEKSLAWSWAQLKEPTWGPDGTRLRAQSEPDGAVDFPVHTDRLFERPVREQPLEALSPLTAPPDSP